MQKKLNIFIIIVIQFLDCYYLNAAQKIWIGPVTDDWENPMNWQPQGVPAVMDDVILDNSVQKNNYTITFNAVVNIHSLSIEPTDGNVIELVIPPENKNSPALIIGETGNSFNIKKGGIFRNASGLASGQSVQFNGLLSLFNEARYIHNSRSSHATEIVAKLSTAAGTEKGIFEFDVPGGSYPISLSNRIYGTLVLSSAASGGTQTYNASGSNQAVINGDFQVSDGVQFNLDLTKDMIINGDYIQNGGIFNIASQPNNNTIKIKGDVHQSSSSTVTETSGGLPLLELAGDVNQQVSIAGNILNDVSVKINNAKGITLISPLKLSYQLQMTEGVIRTSQTNLLTLLDNCVVWGASGKSFVDGPVKKIGDDDFEFPIGKQGDYAPLKIIGSGGAVTDEFQAEYFLGNPELDYGATFENPPVIRISKLEFWKLERLTGSSVKKISVYVGNYSNATALDKLVVVRWDAGKLSWMNEGNSSFSGIATGTLISNDVTNFGAFALASTVEAQNPLPLMDIKLEVDGRPGNFELSWEYPGIVEIDHFEIEQSLDGIHYQLAGNVAIKKGVIRYFYDEVNNSLIARYFRLKIVQKNAAYFYSRAVVIPGSERSAKIIKSYPSSVGNQLWLEVQAWKKESIIMLFTDMNGKRMKSLRYTLVDGANVIHVLLPELAGGVYYISLYGNEGMYGYIRFVKIK